MSRNFLSLMKTLFLFGAAIAVLGLAVAPMSGQTQSTITSSTSYVQTSKLVGTKVKSSQGEEIGVIKDVVLDRNTGCMAYTVLSTGGTGARVSGSGKTVAVPWAVYSPTSDLSVLTVTVDRDRIYSAPVFDYARIEEYTSTNYINNVYSYYGVSAGEGVSGTTTTGTTTTTGVAGTAGATASPGVSPTAAASPAVGASPAATGSPAATASPARKRSPSPHATTSPGPEGAATASPSTRGSRGARGRPGAASPSPGGRSETTAPGEGEASPSEATGSSPIEGKKSSRQRETERGSRGAPSATPQNPEEQE
jgi:sporulation protein YlmC with PRC-barrel domain